MLVEIIKKIAEETQEDRQPYKHRPSAACKCIRQQVYHAMKIEPKRLAGRALLVFDDSTWHEELTADWLRKSSYQIHSQQLRVEIFDVNGYKVSGSIDGIITDILGKDYLWEHKALSMFGFEKIEKSPTDAHEYYMQCALYLFGLRKINPDIKEAILHIKNKNTANYLEYLVELTKSDVCNVYTLSGTNRDQLVYTIVQPIVDAMEKFLAIDKCLETGEIPGRPYLHDDWHCSYCGWNELCWQGYQEEVENAPQGVDLSSYIPQGTIDEYMQVKSIKSESEKKEKELKKQIKELMEVKNYKSGYVGSVAINREFRDVKGFTVAPRTDEILTIKYRRE